MKMVSETPSYQKINYTLRPAKNIERKMIAEACSLLGSFQPVQGYRYIGFGSPFFSDFRLFHRILGFKEMINIEAELSDQDRFEFNKPFHCIEMIYGRASEVLSTLQWSGLPTVVWLDYDSQLSMEMLDDIGYLTAELEIWSLLLITVRSKALDFGEESEKLAALKGEFGYSLPPGIGQKELAQTRFSTTLRSIINGRIAEVMVERNAALPRGDRLGYRQIFNFVYDDGTPMLTLGGVVSRESDRDRLDSCGFDSLEYCRTESDPYEIRVPNLTFKEQRHLDAQLPGCNPQSPGVPARDLEAYGRVYRYFPTFTEIEL